MKHISTSVCACLLLAMCVMASASSVWPAGTPDGVPSARARKFAPKTVSSSCFASRQVTVDDQVNTALGLPAVTTPAFCGTVSSPLCPAGDYRRFDSNGVKAHFDNQPPGFAMTDVRHTPFSCVDARGDEPMLGTPGGDLSEAMNAAMAIMKVRNLAYSDAIADEVLAAFFDNVATPTRPMYFHTDDSRLRSMFAYLKTVLVSEPQPTVMPFRGPSDAVAREAWLEALSTPAYNGCGHIRLQMESDATNSPRKFFSVARAGTLASTVQDCSSLATPTAANCLDSAAVAKRFVRGFFQYWWFSPTGSPQRQKVNFAVDGILVGPLLGKAVTIIGNQAAPGTSQHSCADHAPLVRPLFGASKVFVYHPTAVEQWRNHTALNGLRSVLARYGVTTTAQIQNFQKTWTAIAGMQLGATLQYLAPANDLGIFPVTVPVGASRTLASQSAEALTTPEEPVAVPVVTAAVPAADAVATAAELVEPVVGTDAVTANSVVTESGR